MRRLRLALLPAVILALLAALAGCGSSGSGSSGGDSSTASEPPAAESGAVAPTKPLTGAVAGAA